MKRWLAALVFLALPALASAACPDSLTPNLGLLECSDGTVNWNSVLIKPNFQRLDFDDQTPIVITAGTPPTIGLGTVPSTKGGTGVTNYTKGQLLVGLSDGSLDVLTPGADGYALVADSTETSGYRFAAIATVPFSDASALLFDNLDPTKKARFELSGISTGTTRIYTLQNRDGTLADLGPNVFTDNQILDDQKSLRFREAVANGTNYIEIKAPASVASNRICTLEDDATPFDSCVTGGGGSSIILDLGDDAGNDSTALSEIATSGDTNGIFGEPSADKLLIDLTKDWPKSDTSDDLTCTNCIGGTEIDESTLDDDLLPFDDADSNFAATALGPAIEEFDNVNGSGPNAADGKVEWTQLVGVPAGFADGADDGAGGTGYATIKDETTSLTQRTVLAFLGAGVSCADNSGTSTTECTISGGGSSKPFESWTAQQAFLPASSFATQDTRNNHPVLDFDASADECAYFGGVLPAGYAGGGLTVGIVWLATSATSGATGWLTAFERHDDDVTDLDADSFGTEKSSSATTASASGETQYTELAHTSGAEIDSLAAGESFRLRVCRDGNGSTVTDDMTGDAELYKIYVKEP